MNIVAKIRHKRLQLNAYTEDCFLVQIDSSYFGGKITPKSNIFFHPSVV